MMTAFDYVAITVVGLSVVVGLVRGAVKEVFTLAGWIAAFVAANRFYDEVATMLVDLIEHPFLRGMAAFLTVFVLVLMLVGIASLIASALIKNIGLAAIDRTLGLFVGAARGVVIMLVLVIVGGFTPLPEQPSWRNALTSKWFEALAVGVKPWLPQGWAKHIHLGSRKA